MKRHAVDPFSLVAGVLLGFLALFFLSGDHTVNDLGWPWATVVPALAIGLAAVFTGIRRAVVPRGDEALTAADESVGPTTTDENRDEDTGGQARPD